MTHKIHHGFWILAILSVIIVFFNLGGLPLLDPDEPVYAETPKEMMAFNDYISPRIYGEFWYDKPPMYYWLVAASFKLFGVSEFAARFPSAMLAVGCLLAVYYFGSRMFNQRAGFSGALVLATSLEFYYLSKAAVTDMTLLFTLTVCLLAFLSKKYYLFYIFAGLATVTKGPIGLIFPGAIVFLYFVVTGRWSQLRSMHLPLGLLLYAVVAVPWYGTMYMLHGMDFINTFFGFNNITRFTNPEHPEGVLWYYFIPVLIVGFFPWIAVLLQAVWSSLRNSSRDFYQLVFLNIWAAFIFIFFSISQTKLVSYILPVFPPIAMIVGWYIDHIWEYRRNRSIISWPVVTSLLTLLLCAGLCYAVRFMPQLRTGVILQVVILVFMLLGMWFFYWEREPGKMMMVKAVAVTFFSLVLFGVMIPQVAPKFTSQEVAATFLKNYDGQSPVYVIKFLHPGFAFYSNVYGVELELAEELHNSMAKQEKAYFVVRQVEYEALTVQDKQKVEVIAVTADKYLLLKR